MSLRHEWKIEISPADYLALRSRLRVLTRSDPHGSRYTVRSLYFDTPADRALREKINGVDRREKFRIRCYDGDFRFLRLEKKSKQNGLCRKDSAVVSAGDVRRLLAGDTEWMRGSGSPPVRELYSRMNTELLAPKTVVEYTREPFVYAAGNVRVTLDSGLRTGIRGIDFLNPDMILIPAGDAPILMEVKWDEFLPDVIRDAVQMPGRRAQAYSKYAACRIYG